MHLNVLARPAIQTSVLIPTSSAKVRRPKEENDRCHANSFLRRIFVDSCLKDNGGCDKDAACSHDQATNAVKCTCKTGYTNTGSESNVTCKGNTFRSNP